MNAKQAKRLRQRAKQLTPHLPHEDYREGKTTRLGECTRGAYKALKSRRFRIVDESATL
jgi:hypothetical protein